MIRKKKIQSNEGLGNRDRQDENTKSRVGFLPHYDKWHTIRFLFIFFFVLLISSCQEWLFSNAKKDDFTFLHL